MKNNLREGLIDFEYMIGWGWISPRSVPVWKQGILEILRFLHEEKLLVMEFDPSIEELPDDFILRKEDLTEDGVYMMGDGPYGNFRSSFDRGTKLENRLKKFKKAWYAIKEQRQNS